MCMEGEFSRDSNCHSAACKTGNTRTGYAGKKKARIEALAAAEGVEDQLEPAEEDISGLEHVLQGSVARIVLKSALISIPDSLQFRQKLFKVLESVSLPGIEVLADDLYTDLQVHVLRSGIDSGDPSCAIYDTLWPTVMFLFGGQNTLCISESKFYVESRFHIQQPWISSHHGYLQDSKGLLQYMHLQLQGQTVWYGWKKGSLHVCSDLIQAPVILPKALASLPHAYRKDKLLQAKFGDSEEAWDMRARRSCATLELASEDNASPDLPAEIYDTIVSTYEDAVSIVPTKRMFDLYTAFLLDQVIFTVEC